MKRCPKCSTEVDGAAKFCSACGARLETEVVDAAWIAGMQEEIKDAKHNVWIFGGGMLLSFLIGFIPIATADFVSTDSPLLGASIRASGFFWIGVLIGVVGFIGCSVCLVYSGRRADKLTRELKEGKR